MIPVVVLEAAAELAGEIARVPFVAGEVDEALFGEGLALRLVPLARPRRRSALAAAAYAVADLLAASRAGVTSVQATDRARHATRVSRIARRAKVG